MTRGMIDLLRSALGDDAQITPEDEAQLRQRHAQARVRWPGVEVPFVVFGPYVVSRLPERMKVSEGLDALMTEDLYLACGCALGEPGAIAAFETQVLEGMQPRLRRLASSPDEAADLLQHLRQKLLVGEAGVEPRIASYGGRGALASWVKVVAVREGLMARRARRGVVDDDDALELAAGREDPELDHMRSHYQREFREAFAQAFETLEPSERNLLRYHLVDRLGIDHIATIEGIHRATVARRLARVRERLNLETRARLTRRLCIDGGELESILRLVRSRLEVSVRRLLIEP
jgi:RNA polymerase sigma-70 factor, ECF subfamily